MNYFTNICHTEKNEQLLVFITEDSYTAKFTLSTNDKFIH